MKADEPRLAPYAYWLDTLELAMAEPGRVSRLHCPNCDAQTVNLVYVIRSPGNLRGTSAFWCGTCLNGMMPRYGLVPAGVDTVLDGTEDIPDYALAVPDDEERSD